MAMNLKKNDKVLCIKSWRPEGNYIWGGKAPYQKGRFYYVEFVLNFEGKTIIVLEGWEQLYTTIDPLFSDYFVKYETYLRKQKLLKINEI